MVKVSIIGSGNVAQHLIAAFLKSNEIEVVQVFSRNPNDIAALISVDKITSDIATLQQADVYIIAISDSAVASVSQQFSFTDRLVVHTSGSLPIEIIDAKNRRGVFYPLQTFSKGIHLDFKEIPICLEAEDTNDLPTLQKVAWALSDKIFHINTPQRKALHVAAVFANNFTNHLYGIAAEICEENKIPFDILKPLIRQTADKTMQLQPKAAQTGPAIRHDDITIKSHLSFLEDESRKNIYEILTKSIQHDASL